MVPIISSTAVPVFAAGIHYKLYTVVYFNACQVYIRAPCDCSRQLGECRARSEVHLSAMHGAQDCAHMHGHCRPTWRDHESWLGAQSMSAGAYQNSHRAAPHARSGLRDGGGQCNGRPNSESIPVNVAFADLARDCVYDRHTGKRKKRRIRRTSSDCGVRHTLPRGPHTSFAFLTAMFFRF